MVAVSVILIQESNQQQEFELLTVFSFAFTFGFVLKYLVAGPLFSCYKNRCFKFV